MMVQLLQEKLQANKECWYVLSVTFGREPEIKTKLVARKELDLIDVVAPERLVNSESDIYKYFMGYVFVKTFLTIPKYIEILELENVYRFLGGVYVLGVRNFVYVPYKVSDKEVLNTKDYLTGKKSIDEDSRLSLKDRVMITKGDLANIKGKVIEINKTTVKVLPDSFFQNVIVVPTTSVIKI